MRLKTTLVEKLTNSCKAIVGQYVTLQGDPQPQMNGLLKHVARMESMNSLLESYFIFDEASQIKVSFST